MPLSKVSRGFHPSLALDLARVDRIAAIVTGTVFHKRNQLSMRHDWIVGTDCIQNRTDGFHDFYILLLAVPADIVGFSDSALGQNLRMASQWSSTKSQSRTFCPSP